MQKMFIDEEAKYSEMLKFLVETQSVNSYRWVTKEDENWTQKNQTLIRIE